MRTRLILAMVSILTLALGLAATGSLLLVRNATRQTAIRNTVQEAETLASATKQSPFLQSLENNPSDFAAVLNLAGSVAGLSSTGTLLIKAGKIEGSLPTGLSVNSLSAYRLSHNQASSGAFGNVAFAAVPLVTLPADAGGGTIVLLLDSPINNPVASAWYFALAAGVALAVAVTGTALIATRISHHVVAAADAAKRIAGGDFEARIEIAERDYPELAALGTSLNTMATGLARARFVERQFLLSISHDLRTPLTSIRGYAEAIADGAIEDPTKAAGIVLVETARLERLIRDLLDLAYLDTHRFSLHSEEIDLGATVALAAQSLLIEAEANQLNIDVVLPKAPIIAIADPDRIAQIVSNVVENAIHYARDVITISVTSTSWHPESDMAKCTSIAPDPDNAKDFVETAVICITDDGPGIDDEDLPHIFERLYTSRRKAVRSTHGTGLGLAIVAELAEAMGGVAKVISPVKSGIGTAFKIEIPIHNETILDPE